MHLYDCIKSTSLRVPFGLAETGTCICTCIIFLYYCNVTIDAKHTLLWYLAYQLHVVMYHSLTVNLT